MHLLLVAMHLLLLAMPLLLVAPGIGDWCRSSDTEAMFCFSGASCPPSQVTHTRFIAVLHVRYSTRSEHIPTLVDMVALPGKDQNGGTPVVPVSIKWNVVHL